MRKRSNLLLAFLLPVMAMAQSNVPESSLNGGKGLTFIAADNSASLKFSLRIQPLLVVNARDFEVLTDPNLDEINMSIRRARLKFDGHLYDPKLTYKFELAFGMRNIGGVSEHTGLGARIILDAVVKYQFAKGTSIWFGQTKLPGNRERVVSSQKLQTVDRSIANGRFNIDRDMGFQLHGKYMIGEMPINAALAISVGEGRNILDNNIGGLEYTGRIEWLPFGKFKSKGDYFLADLAREETHKLSIGITGDLNDKAIRQRGNQGSWLVGEDSLGNVISYNQTLKSIFIDAIWKYNGWSALGEFFYKTADNPVWYDENNNRINSYYTGTGFSGQAGYVFKSNWELAGRYSMVQPDKDVDVSLGNQTQYTAVVSRYILGHALKVQSDLTYSIYELEPGGEWMFRFQIEVAL